MKKTRFWDRKQNKMKDISSTGRQENQLPGTRYREFDSMVIAHLSPLYSRALKITNNKTDAEDLVQETLFKVFRAFDQYQKNTNFRAWAFRIMINTFITAFRKASLIDQKASYNDFEEFYLYKKIDKSLNMLKTAEEDFHINSFDDHIKEALENVPYKFRLVVLLRDLKGFTYNEIANIIHSPLGTVMSRLYRGRKLLQRSLRMYAKKRGYLVDEID